MILFIWLGLLIVSLAFYFRKVYSRFSAYGVPNLKSIPLIGNISGVILQRRHIAEVYQMSYNAFPDHRFVGQYDFMMPVLVIRDPELVKKITVKDYEYFHDHRTIVDDTVDALFGRILFLLKGQEWKEMRSTLSPAFTNSKIQNMMAFMIDVNSQMIDMIKEKIDQSGTGFIDMECKDLTSRYSNDVIASCAYGIKINSHVNENNEFYLMGRSATNFRFKKMIVFFGYTIFPSVIKKLNMKLIGDGISSFFRNLVLNNMKEREVHKLHRPDMIHLLMEAKKGNLTMTIDEMTQDADASFAAVKESKIGQQKVHRSWTDDDLVSQAFMFFLAGFETVSTAMSFLLYEMAVHPEVQERLVQEINEDFERNGGKMDYNSLQKMNYLDMVISEILRLWPPAVGMDRQCTKDYNMGKSSNTAKHDYILRKGESVSIPTFALHRDPAYFPDPDKFDPERFSMQNKHNIKPYTYLPFGSGPRNCIGSRFALAELKVMLYQLLQQFELSPCAKTMIPVELTKYNLNLEIKGGHWIRIAPRK